MGFQYYTLIYRASRDGFGRNDFQNKCDNVIGTVVLVKSEKSFIFGGFTKANWVYNFSSVQINQLKNDSNAFLFSLVNNYNTSVKLNILKSPKYAIVSDNTNGFGFGLGYDFYIADQSNSTDDSYSYLYTYQLPFNLIEGSLEANSFLAGSYHFKISEIEVYSIKKG